MRTLYLGIVSIFLFCFLSSGWADNQAVSWFKIDEKKQVSLRVDLFLSSTCAYCEKASQFFKSIEPQNPWLDIHRYVINDDKAALQTYHSLLKQQNLDDFMVPAVFFCNTRWVGFADAEKSGKKLLENMNYCRQQIAEKGYLSSTTEQVLKQTSNASWYENSMVAKPGALALLTTMALFDAFNPGAMVLIVTLFSLVVIQKRRDLQIGTIILFLMGVAVAHYMQQAFTATFYQLVAMFRSPAALVGLGLLAYLYFIRSENRSSKKSLSAIFCLILVFLAGLAIQTYQQMHMTNFSLIFQQWIVTQGFTPLAQHLYDMAYQLLYVLAIGFMSLLMVLMFRYYAKWLGNTGFARDFGWQYLLIIGLVMIFYPYVLVNALFTFLVFILVLASSWIGYKIRSRQST